MIENKHCSYCTHSHQVTHIEMSRDAGTDTYCDFYDELKLGYCTGDHCLFWKLKEHLK